jgi:hypothetical protein
MKYLEYLSLSFHKTQLSFKQVEKMANYACAKTSVQFSKTCMSKRTSEKLENWMAQMKMTTITK